MTFAHPWILTLLLIPLALAVWELSRRGRVVPQPYDHAAPPRRRAVIAPAALRAAALLPAVALAAATLALAGPQRLGPPRQERALTNIEFLLDVSGSMSSSLASGQTRYEAAMSAIQDFTEQREGDAFGLTIFGGEVVRWVPLTQDLSAIRQATPFLDPATLPPHLGSTRIGAALRYSGEVLASREGEGDRLLVLLSDGFSSDLGGGQAEEIAAELAAEDVVVYAIHIGDAAAPPELESVVYPTGGEALAAGDPAGLRRVFAHIDRLQPIQEKPAAPEPVDWFTPFARVLLGAIGLHTLALFGLRCTPW